jgi:hypothetical protein
MITILSFNKKLWDKMQSTTSTTVSISSTQREFYEYAEIVLSKLTDIPIIKEAMSLGAKVEVRGGYIGFIPNHGEHEFNPVKDDHEPLIKKITLWVTNSKERTARIEAITSFFNAIKLPSDWVKALDTENTSPVSFYDEYGFTIKSPKHNLTMGNINSAHFSEHGFIINREYNSDTWRVSYTGSLCFSANGLESWDEIESFITKKMATEIIKLTQRKADDAAYWAKQ